MRLLSSLFAIEICAFSVMQNHTHLVLKVTSEEHKSWSTEDVVRRWFSMFKGPLLVRKFLNTPVSMSVLNHSSIYLKRSKPW